MGIIEHNGKTYRVDIVPDDDNNPPWQQEDGHGPVSDWRNENYMGYIPKEPGERVLHRDGRSALVYDFAEAIRIAKRDGWDAPPYRTGTPGERAQRAVEADYWNLRRWCEGDWWYCGVVVTERRTDPDGFEYDGPSTSLWGIESNATDYIEDEVVQGLIAELEAD